MKETKQDYKRRFGEVRRFVYIDKETVRPFAKQLVRGEIDAPQFHQLVLGGDFRRSFSQKLDIEIHEIRTRAVDFAAKLNGFVVLLHDCQVRGIKKDTNYLKETFNWATFVTDDITYAFFMIRHWLDDVYENEEENDISTRNMLFAILDTRADFDFRRYIPTKPYHDTRNAYRRNKLTQAQAVQQVLDITYAMCYGINIRKLFMDTFEIPVTNPLYIPSEGEAQEKLYYEDRELTPFMAQLAQRLKESRRET